MVKIIIIKAQPKKKKKKGKWAGPKMLWESWEAWDLDWSRKSKSDVAGFGKDKKKNLLALPISLYTSRKPVRYTEIYTHIIKFFKLNKKERKKTLVRRNLQFW